MSPPTVAPRPDPRFRVGVSRVGLDLSRDPHRGRARAADGARGRALLRCGRRHAARARARPDGSRARRARELRAIAVMAVLMLIGGNGLVVWAEQAVPSGLAALLVATVPIWMAGLAALPPAQRAAARRRRSLGSCSGFSASSVLVRPSLGARRRRLAACWRCSSASFSWSCGSMYSRHAGIRADPDHGDGLGDVLRRTHVSRASAP